MNPIALTIAATPRTKKTSNRTFDIGRRCRLCHRGQRTIVKPSEAFEAFEAAAVPQLKRQWSRPPLAEPVLVEAIFYREALRGDLVGYQQALADVLQAAAVLADDKWIIGWPVPADGYSLRKSVTNPRVELLITPLGLTQPELAL